jgi:hypothetical protein
MLIYCFQNTFHDWLDTRQVTIFGVLTEFVTSALFWVVTQGVAVIPYRRFGTNYLSEIQGSRNALGVLPGFLDPLTWDL